MTLTRISIVLPVTLVEVHYTDADAGHQMTAAVFNSVVFNISESVFDVVPA